MRGMDPLTTRARRLREASRAETSASAFLWYAEAEGGAFSALELLRMRKRLPRGWSMVVMVGEEASALDVRKARLMGRRGRHGPWLYTQASSTQERDAVT